jgi:hypothetical protein
MKKKFSLQFLEDFQYDAEFYALYKSMEIGTMTPYQVIEHLCRGKKEVTKTLEEFIINSPIGSKLTNLPKD